MLEEEYVARKSFWRRQRHRERELSEHENSLTRQVLEDDEVTMNHVSERLELISEGKVWPELTPTWIFIVFSSYL